MPKPLPSFIHTTHMRNGLIRLECHRPGCSWFRDFDPSTTKVSENIARLHVRDCRKADTPK